MDDGFISTLFPHGTERNPSVFSLGTSERHGSMFDGIGELKYGSALTPVAEDEVDCDEIKVEVDDTGLPRTVSAKELLRHVSRTSLKRNLSSDSANFFEEYVDDLSVTDMDDAKDNNHGPSPHSFEFPFECFNISEFPIDEGAPQVYPNSRTPYKIETDLFVGHVMLKLRTPEPEDPYFAEYFKGKQR